MLLYASWLQSRKTFHKRVMKGRTWYTLDPTLCFAMTDLCLCRTSASTLKQIGEDYEIGERVSDSPIPSGYPTMEL